MARLCQLLSIEVPIIQAPIGHASGPEPVAAVCETGALGMLSMTWREVPEIRRVIRGIRDRTERPFGVNLVLERGQDARLDACLRKGCGSSRSSGEARHPASTASTRRAGS